METVSIYYGTLGELTTCAGSKGKCETAGGRALLSFGLQNLYQLKLKEEWIKKGSHGKPYLPLYPEIHFNISHSGDYAVCALSSVSIGVDIQKIAPPRNRHILQRVMSDAEQKQIEASANPDVEFVRFWTRKESYLKWTGEGITRELHSIPPDGNYTFFSVDSQYIGCLCSKESCEIKLERVRGCSRSSGETLSGTELV